MDFWILFLFMAYLISITYIEISLLSLNNWSFLLLLFIALGYRSNIRNIVLDKNINGIIYKLWWQIIISDGLVSGDHPGQSWPGLWPPGYSKIRYLHPWFQH